MPTTSRVEGDFLLVNYRKNYHCSNLSDFALEEVITLISSMSSKMQFLISNKQENFIKTSFLPCLRVHTYAHPTYPILKFIYCPILS